MADDKQNLAVGGLVVAQFAKLDILVNDAAIAGQGRTVDDPDLDTFRAANV